MRIIILIILALMFSGVTVIADDLIPIEDADDGYYMDREQDEELAWYIKWPVILFFTILILLKNPKHRKKAACRFTSIKGFLRSPPKRELAPAAQTITPTLFIQDS